MHVERLLLKDFFSKYFVYFHTETELQPDLEAVPRCPVRQKQSNTETGQTGGIPRQRDAGTRRLAETAVLVMAGLLRRRWQAVFYDFDG